MTDDQTEIQRAADELLIRLKAYREIKAAARFLAERLEERRDETFWAGAKRRPKRPRAARLW